MSSSESKDPVFPVLSADLQIQFWTRLQLFRTEYLAESLATVVRSMDVTQIDRDLAEYVGGHRLSELAASRIRGEAFYPVPCVLRAKPALLGYYRLLYGMSQKEFYDKGPFGRFRALEERGKLSPATERLLPSLCRSLVEAGWVLFNGIQLTSSGTINELQLLTVGPQFRGTRNNVIGQDATKVVFELVRSLIGSHLASSSDQVMTVRNAAGRNVSIVFSSDPDIAIMETLPTMAIPSVSIEIKGGEDVSNVHNRIGEAEKSHQKAKAAGFTQFWTIVNARLDRTLAHKESPTTTVFFKFSDLLTDGTDAHNQFRDLLYQTIGIA